MTKEKTIKCKWCGSLFTVPRTREFNAVKYCCIRCRHYAYLESHREARRRYEKKYNRTDNKHHLGNSNIKEHANPDFIRELKIVERELKRLNL